MPQDARNQERRHASDRLQVRPAEPFMRMIFVVFLAILVAGCMAAVVFWSTGPSREKNRGVRDRSIRRSLR